MEQLYKVTICKYKDKEKTEYGYRFIIDENSFQEFIGVKEGDLYINISDGMPYRTLKKKGNYIDQSEEKNIKFDEYYVNYVDLYKEPMEKDDKKNYVLSLRHLFKRKTNRKTR